MWAKVKNLLFRNTTTRQTVAKNTFWLTVSDIGGRLLRAIVIIYAARVLGTAGWGIFSYVLSLTALLTVFSDIGIGPIIVREGARLKEKPEERKQMLSAAFLIRIVLVAGGIFLIFLAAPHLVADPSVKKLLPFAVFIFALDAIRNFGFSLIRALEKMEVEAALYLLTNAAIVAFGFFFLILNAHVISFAAAYTLGVGVGTIATVYTLRAEFKNVFARFPLRLVKYILAAGWPLALSGILGGLMIDTDVLIIGWFRSAEDVGLYSAAQRIVQLLYAIPAILVASLLPTFSRLAGKDDAKFKRGLESALWLAYMVAIPLAVGGVLLGKEIIGFTFGAEYAGASLSFQILITTLLVNFSAVILSSVLFTYDKQKRLISYMAIGGVSNIALDLVLIPAYGIAGSAAATFMAQLAGNAYLWFAVRPIVQPSVIPRLKKILAASALMGIAAFALNSLGLHVLFSIGISAVAYFGILHILREPLAQEVKLILNPLPAVSAAPKNDEPRSG